VRRLAVGHGLVILGAILLFLAVSTFAANPRPLVATVERVSDGNTITAIIGNQTKLRIRLLGIDAPERGHEPRPQWVRGEDGSRC